MSLATNVQTTNGATAAAAPASVAPTWAAAGAGNTLLLFVAVALSGAPTLSTPAGWTLVTNSVQGTVVAVYVYTLPGAVNAGGSTTVTINLTNVNGVAWILYELLNSSPVQPIDGGNILTNTNVGSTAVSLPTAIVRRIGAVRELGAVARLSGGGTFTPNGSGGQAAWTNDAGAQPVSTVGATNVQLSVHSLQQGAAPQLGATFAGTLAVSAAWAAAEVTAISSSSSPIGYAGGGGQPDITQGYAVVGNA